MTVSETLTAGPELSQYIGREVAFIYNGKPRTGELDSVHREVFTVKVDDAESQFKSFRFDRVEDGGIVHVL